MHGHDRFSLIQTGPAGGSESRQLLMIPSHLAFPPFSCHRSMISLAPGSASFICGDLKSLHQNLLRHMHQGSLLGQSLLATFLRHLVNSLHALRFWVLLC
jgi:hypothetical protein